MNNLETMRLLGGCLAPRGEALNGFLAERLNSPGMDWKRLMLIASGHYLAPAFSLALKRRGLWEFLPGEIREILQATELLNRERNAGCYRQLLAIIRRLNSAGIRPLLLKGAISLLPAPFLRVEGRVLGDLDVLVPEDSVEDARRSVTELGYAYDPKMYLGRYENHQHLPPLYHPEHEVPLELHRGVTDPRVKPILETGQMWRCARPAEFDGVEALIPDNYSRLLHNVVHARLQDRHRRDFKLAMRQLNDWVQLRDYCEPEIDWRRMWENFGRHGEATVLEAYCLVARRFFGQPLPAGIEPSRAAILSERIMCLAQRGPVWSFLLDGIKNYTRLALTPSVYVREFRKWQAARRG
ncbi:MAG: nucleotidyltransferase family protein [Planctomycetota bacterium]